MNIRPIHTEVEYQAALRLMDDFFDNEPEPGSPAGNHFEVLTILIEAYENKRHPISTDLDPIEMLHFAIESMGRTQKQLGELLGSRSRASEILSRSRPLTLEQIRLISEQWKLPIAVLAQPYRLARHYA